MPPRSELYSSVESFRQPRQSLAVTELLETFIPYIALNVVIVMAVQRGHPVVALALSGLAAAFLVRVFVIFHDCCHGSFFSSRRANRIVGYAAGLLTLTPFDKWQRSHAEHHATAGDLDRRGVGDVWTLTTREYTRRERFSVHFINAGLVAALLVAHLTIGLPTVLLIQLPTLLLAGAIGVWLFYVQHQFEDVYWAHPEAWDPMRAALEGSSYYKLPKVLQCSRRSPADAPPQPGFAAPAPARRKRSTHGQLGVGQRGSRSRGITLRFPSDDSAATGKIRRVVKTRDCPLLNSP